MAVVRARLPMPSEYGFKLYEILNCDYHPDSPQFKALLEEEKNKFRKVHVIDDEMVIIKDDPLLLNRESGMRISRTWPMRKEAFAERFGRLPKQSYEYETIVYEEVR
jgi:hypothetical protein